MLQVKLCECLCGDYVKPGNRFIQGHNFRQNTREVSLSYLEAKAWITNAFEKHRIMVRWGKKKDKAPKEIAIAAYRNGKYIIGVGKSFAHAVESLMEKLEQEYDNTQQPVLSLI